MLQAVPLVGAAAALVLVVGGPLTPLAFLLCYVVVISVHEVAIDHYFPWDSLLLESTVLCVFLPHTHAVGGDAGWGMTAPPTPLLAFLFRWLLFRMMWGFGKLKFSAHTHRDDTYIKNFFIHMPITSPLGWLGHFLPDAAHRANLVVMWLVEIPLPFCLFLAGWPRVVAALGYIGLMAGIHATGNFGYFNVLTAVLVLPQLAHSGSLLEAAWGPQGVAAALYTGVLHLLRVPSLAFLEVRTLVGEAAVVVGATPALRAAEQGVVNSATSLLQSVLSSAPALPPAAMWAPYTARILARSLLDAPLALAWWAMLTCGQALHSVGTMAWTSAVEPALLASCGTSCRDAAGGAAAAFASAVSTGVLGGTLAANPAAASSLPNTLTDTLPHTLLLALAVCIILPLSLLNLPFNSWITVGWPYWPTLLKAQPAWLLQRAFAFVRAILPFRLVHAYGVFPPHSAPGVRWVVVYEGSADGRRWLQWQWPATITHEFSPPRFIAPYMPRKDHDLFYESNGMGNGHNFMKLFGTGNPYRHTRSTPWHRIQARLLQGSFVGRSRNQTLGIFANNPFPDPAHPPKFVRCSLYMFEPTSIAEWWATGKWWRGTHAGYNLPAATAEDTKGTWEEWLSPPEAWWGEAVIWKRRAGTTVGGVSHEEYEEAWAFIAALRKAAARRVDAVADARASQASSVARALPMDVQESDAEASLPETAQEAMDPAVARRIFTWEQVHEVVLSLRRWYSPAKLRRVELTLARMLAPLQARLEAVFLRTTPTDAELQSELQAFQRAAEHMPASAWAKDAAWDCPEAAAASAHAAAAHGESEEATASRVRRLDPVQAALIGSVTSEEKKRSTQQAAAAAWARLSSANPLPYIGLGGEEEDSAPERGVPDWKEIYMCLAGLIEQPVVGQAPRGGYFSTPFKIANYAQWYLLVGGAKLYERAVGGKQAIVGGHPLPLVWPPPPSTGQGWAAESAFERAGGTGASLPALFRTTCTPHLNASHTTPESAFYLTSVLHYDTLAMTACKGRLNWELKRHDEEAAAERPGAVTPGFIDLLPDVRQCENLRLWDPVAAAWTPKWIVPRWEQGRADGEWVMESDGRAEAGREPLGHDVDFLVNPVPVAGKQKQD